MVKSTFHGFYFLTISFFFCLNIPTDFSCFIVPLSPPKFFMMLIFCFDILWYFSFPFKVRCSEPNKIATAHLSLIPGSDEGSCLKGQESFQFWDYVISWQDLSVTVLPLVVASFSTWNKLITPWYVNITPCQKTSAVAFSQTWVTAVRLTM